MDYKYIEQLVERYWVCETSLEEEEILRMFFSQKDVPASLRRYQALFAYEQNEHKSEVLGDDFDKKMLATIDEQEPVKAKVVTMRQRFMPLFRAAAVVAIILTLGNAIEVSVNEKPTAPTGNMAEYNKPDGTPSVAKADSAKLDSLKQGTIQQPTAIVK